jgi:molybdate transport system permease protein
MLRSRPFLRVQTWGGRLAVGVAVGLLLCLFVLPLLALLVRVPPLDLLRRLSQPVVLEAVRLSLLTTACATALVVVLGLPVAYLLAMRSFPGKRALEALVDLPMVLPPTVAGVGLLLAFGRAGLAGRALAVAGVSLPFTTAAVVLAQTFVAAPVFITTAAAGLREVEQRYLEAAATLRAGPGFALRHVLLPLSLPSLLAGAAMTWARALGEFGATITFAGNLPGRTQTMPLAVYIALQTDLDASVTLSVLLVLVSFSVLVLLRWVPERAALFRSHAPSRRP